MEIPKHYYIPRLEELYHGFNIDWKHKGETEWQTGSFNIKMGAHYEDYDIRVEKLHPDHLAAYGFRKKWDEQVEAEAAQFFTEEARHNEGLSFFFANIALNMYPYNGFSRIIIANASVVPPFLMYNGIIKNDNQLRRVFEQLELVKE